MYKRVLVPLDGSELAETAFPYAREIAVKLGLEVILLHVANPQEPELLPVYLSYVKHAAEAFSQPLKAGVKAIKSRGEVIGGYAADSILRFAEDNKVDMIMMTSHGRSGLRYRILGSVADRVLRASKVPVWLVPAPAAEKASRAKKWTLKKVLVPLDGSKLAELVLPHVETLAKPASTEKINVVLLMISQPPPLPTASTPESTMNWGKIIEEHLTQAGKVAEQYLTRIGKRLTSSGINVASEVLVGEATTEIINYASRKHFDLIAMASHGHSGATRWAYGSVADKVVHGATVPVLLVRPQHGQ